MCDYQESVTTGQTHTHGQTNAGQSDPYVPLCLAGDTIKTVESFSEAIFYRLKRYKSFQAGLTELNKCDLPPAQL